MTLKISRVRGPLWLQIGGAHDAENLDVSGSHHAANRHTYRSTASHINDRLTTDRTQVESAEDSKHPDSAGYAADPISVRWAKALRLAQRSTT
jgi:hypothetical protein